MADNAGSIYYDVELDVAQLIAKSRQVNSELDSLGNAAKGAVSTPCKTDHLLLRSTGILISPQ